MNKVTTLDEVMEKVRDGMTIGLGGFLGVGAPLKAVQQLIERKIKNITLVSVVNAHPLAGGSFDIAPLFKNRQVRKFICSHNGTCPEAVAAYRDGDLEVEFFPMGTWTEKLRAGGAGLGGVLTPTGVGTLMEKGKEKMTINGREYLLEMPLRVEIAFIKGYRGDPYGNIEYRGVSLNSNPVLAMAADSTAAEVDEIVAVGDIPPASVGTPGIFVKSLYPGYSYDEHQKLLGDYWAKVGQLKL
ncbi:MAG: 3-oxoacid CoA-transferase subunit A [Negativicutes bacterium]|nr:3-oxoacid CoA-transferase subunit A [Negativicutes bacterium]